MAQFFSPENENANYGLAMGLLSGSGWSPTPQGNGPGMAQAMGGYLQGRQMDRQRQQQLAEQQQWQQLAKEMGLAGVPASAMPGLVSKMLEAQMKPGASQTDDIQEYEFARKTGFKGTFEDWIRQKVRGGGVEPYYSPLVTSTGIYNFDHRSGKTAPITAGGRPVLAPATDPNVKGAVEQAGARGKAVGEYEGGIEKRGKGANEVLDLIDQAEKLLPKATASGFGTIVDAGAALVGKTPQGAEEAAALKVIAGNLRMKQPRMEGPQSNFDSQLYSEMAGQLGDSTLPVSVRQAAAQELKRLNQKYAAFNGMFDAPQDDEGGGGDGGKVVDWGDLK